MEVKLSPELEAKLNRKAAMEGRDSQSLVQEAVERLQHQSIAAERHDGVGFRRLRIAVALDQSLTCRKRVGHLARDERDPVEFSRRL